MQESNTEGTDAAFVVQETASLGRMQKSNTEGTDAAFVVQETASP